MVKKIVILTIVVLIAIVVFKLILKPPKSAVQNSPANTQNLSAQIISTKPDPLEDAIVPATEPIEITFNKPLQNSGEFKFRIDPKLDFKIDLSSDRKTAKISFPKPLQLGVTYTIFIGPDTKFDGEGNWGKEKIFHFKTIKYTGV